MKLSKLATAVCVASISIPAMAVPITTDIISVVDESGSMGGEHAWLGGMMTSLDAALAAAAGGDAFSAQYGLTGYGGTSSGSHYTGHMHDVNGGQFGNAAQYAAATASLVTSGSREDGYEAMDYALNNYSLRNNAVTNLILVTDEDRDIVNNNSITFNSIESLLDSKKSLLNAVLNISIYCDGGNGDRALGVDSSGTGYIADGNGGFTTCENATSSGSSWNDYGVLALGTGGAAWDLNQLRAGGNTAVSFTAAFIDVKVQETVSQVAEPGSLALLGLGLAGLGAARRRKN